MALENIGVSLFKVGVGLARPDIGPLYGVQMLALAVKFGYGELIIPGLVVTDNVKLGYGRLPDVVTTNLLLGYGGF